MVPWLLACTATPPPPGDREPGADSVWVDPEGPAGLEPMWTAEQAASELNRLMTIPLPLTEQVRDPFLELVRAGDEGCPAAPDDQFPEGRVPLGGCTSQTGYHYIGQAEYVPQGQGYLLRGDCAITRPDGVVMGIAGGQRLEVGAESVLIVEGSLSYGAGEGWLGKGFGAVFELTSAGEEDRLRGGLGSLTDSDTIWWELSLEASCASGSLRGRDPRGGWYELVLEDCSCGTVSFGGQPLGDACVDLDLLRAQL